MNAPSFLVSSVLVAFGGAVGSWLRLAVNYAQLLLVGPLRVTGFPYATLIVNVIGSLAMGLFSGWLARHGHANSGEHWRLFMGVGLLGGFTTFSSFALEFALFIERGAIGSALAYVALSLVAGFAGLFLGLMLMRSAL